MTDESARFALPFILPGQAQKEFFHNEALALIDGLLHPVAQSAGLDVPPGSPSEGQGWIVGTTPSGDWSDQANSFAVWTAGGWRFLAPVAAMRIWVADDAVIARWDGSLWSSEAQISAPNGGETIDGEARSAIAAILVALRAHGMIGG